MSKVLKKLLRTSEGDQLDFKLTISDPVKIAKTLSAFANHLGGTLVVGIRDDHTVVGIDAEEEKYVLERAAEVYCDPPVPLQFETVYLPPVHPEGEELVVLLVRVPNSPAKPHYVQHESGDRTLYIRQADQTLPASQSISQQLEQGKYAPAQGNPGPQVKDPHQRRILALVAQEPKITVKLVAKRCNLSERRAQRVLNELAMQGWLREHDLENTVYWTR